MEKEPVQGWRGSCLPASGITGHRWLGWWSVARGRGGKAAEYPPGDLRGWEEGLDGEHRSGVRHVCSLILCPALSLCGLRPVTQSLCAQNAASFSGMLCSLNKMMHVRHQAQPWADASPVLCHQSCYSRFVLVFLLKAYLYIAFLEIFKKLIFFIVIWHQKSCLHDYGSIFSFFFKDRETIFLLIPRNISLKKFFFHLNDNIRKPQETLSGTKQFTFH